MLEYENVSPTAEDLEQGTYPFSKELSFVVDEESVDDHIEAFLEFVSTDGAKQALKTMGYIPSPAGGMK